jgi:bifunctional N-acetylglucosamine-1-phosphate-uridyltransferase/glucosamine-1-phosphate-acetyltransferase GlmU-like protein
MNIHTKRLCPFKRRKAKKDIMTVRKDLCQQMGNLRNNAEGKVLDISMKKGLTDREAKIYDILKKTLIASEKIIAKTLKDLEDT